MSSTSDPSLLSVDEKIHLITRNLVSDEQSLFHQQAQEITRAKLEAGSFKLYWGTATTGKPHIAYFVPISKLADFLRAGCDVTILFADLHAYLDNQKAPWELLKYRTDYYEFIIKSMLESIGVPLDKLKFVRGTEYQLSKEYTIDVYRLTSLVTEHDAQKAGAEVVKKVEHPLLSGLLYPLLQVLDEKYLGVDAQFGGVDQRKIFCLSEKYLHRVDYPRCVHLMNPMVPGLNGAKMSASEVDSKIDILDSASVIAKKIQRAFCEPGNIAQNGVLAFAKHVLFPIFGKLLIKRLEKYGGDVEYTTYDSLEQAYAKQELFPKDLKDGVAAALNTLLDPIRIKANEPAIQELIQKAYPVGDGDAHHPQPNNNNNNNNNNAAANNNKNQNQGKQKQQQQPKQQQPKQQQQKKEDNEAKDISRLDIRVGKVVKVWDHPNANSLFMENIDIGGKTIQVLSGIKGKVPQEEFENSLVLVICNLKPEKLRGETSEAMILAAKLDESIELVRPPEGSQPGDKVFVEGFSGEPAALITLKNKNNPFNSIKEFLKTNDECTACYKDIPLQTASGPCVVSTLKQAFIA